MFYDKKHCGKKSKKSLVNHDLAIEKNFFKSLLQTAIKGVFLLFPLVTILS